MPIVIRVLTSADAEAFRRLRLEALEREPNAFGESAAEHQATPIETIAARLGGSTSDKFVLGAFIGDELIGTVGFARHEGAKRRHRSILWGVYVSPSHRARGAGRELLTELLRRARLVAGLEQIALTVNSRQTAARHLYESVGFEVFGHERESLKIGDSYVDEEHMALRLANSQNAIGSS